MKKLVRNSLIYIPTGEIHLGGLVHVIQVKDDLIFTSFGKYSWKELEPLQEELENKFGDAFAINW